MRNFFFFNLKPANKCREKFDENVKVNLLAF